MSSVQADQYVDFTGARERPDLPFQLPTPLGKASAASSVMKLHTVRIMNIPSRTSLNCAKRAPGLLPTAARDDIARSFGRSFVEGGEAGQ